MSPALSRPDQKIHNLVTIYSLTKPQFYGIMQSQIKKGNKKNDDEI